MLVNDAAHTSATVTGVSALTAEELFAKEFLIDSLYWQETIWAIDGVNVPKLAWEEQQA